MKRNFIYLVMVMMATGLLAGCQSTPRRISILGDSYSTFRNAIPRGNASYYPRPSQKENDVTAKEECWWHLVAQELEGAIEVNESWSGSTICHTGYGKRDASNRSFVTRVDRLGQPTLILVCGGTNDSWAQSPIGEYQWEGWTRENLFSFRPAMAKLLTDLKTLYPQAEVFFILNTDLKKEINDSVHEICNHYHVPCIDLKDIDKQGGHPSVKGMKQFAEQVVEGVRNYEKANRRWWRR